MSGWLEAAAPAKLNLALLVGPLQANGKHEVATVLVRLSLADTVSVREADATRVHGFEDDTLVRASLDAVCGSVGTERRLEARLRKRIPVAAGLGGGSSDAATALVLANRVLGDPLDAPALENLAARLGADVPFFLREGAQLATGDGTTLERLDLPRDYVALLALPEGEVKSSTGAVYAAFDARDGARGFDDRRRALLEALARVERGVDLAHLPRNDLASSPLAVELESLGAFRADVTGAGPAVYGLFSSRDDATRAAATLGGAGTTWMAEIG